MIIFFSNKTNTTSFLKQNSIYLNFNLITSKDIQSYTIGKGGATNLKVGGQWIGSLLSEVCSVTKNTHYFIPTAAEFDIFNFMQINV